MSDSPLTAVAPHGRQSEAESQDRLIRFAFIGLSCVLLFAASGLTVGLIIQTPPPELKWTARERVMAVIVLLVMYLASVGTLLERSPRARLAAAGRWSLAFALPLLWVFLLTIFARGLFAPPPDEPYLRGAAAFFMYLLVLPPAGLILRLADRARRRAKPSPSAGPPPEAGHAASAPSTNGRTSVEPARPAGPPTAAPESVWTKVIAAPIFVLCLPILLVNSGGISQLMIGLMFLVAYGGLPFWGELAGAAFGHPLLGAACGAVVLLSPAFVELSRTRRRTRC